MCFFSSFSKFAHCLRIILINFNRIESQIDIQGDQAMSSARLKCRFDLIKSHPCFYTGNYPATFKYLRINL